MSSPKNKVVVIAALLGNLAVAVTKFIAAGMTGSSAMLSEGVHSLVDTTNQGLMLYGMHRAKQPPNARYPFGHGRELYFWAFIVALLVFAVGAGLSVYEGVTHIRAPEPLKRPLVTYGVLAAAMVFEGITWTIAFREFRRTKGDMGWFEAFRKSKDPTTFTVLFEDTAAVLGLVIAAIGVAAAQWFDDPRLDGVASIAIGVLLAVTAALLARETKALLLGESAANRIHERILAIADADPDVHCTNGVITQQYGPDTVVASLSAEFDDALTTPRIEDCIHRIEHQVRRAHPEVVALFVKPQTAATWRRRFDGPALEPDDAAAGRA